MSKVAWCDGGDHAYKANQEGSATFAGTQYDKDGNPVQVTMDYCAEHNPARIQAEAQRYAISQDVYRKVTDVIADDE